MEVTISISILAVELILKYCYFVSVLVTVSVGERHKLEYERKRLLVFICRLLINN